MRPMRYHYYPDAALKLPVQFICDLASCGEMLRDREEHRECC
jgi:hypothetical protein